VYVHSFSKVFEGCKVRIGIDKDHWLHDRWISVSEVNVTQTVISIKLPTLLSIQQQTCEDWIFDFEKNLIIKASGFASMENATVTSFIFSINASVEKMLGPIILSSNHNYHN
jgi:hypothetical protein